MLDQQSTPGDFTLVPALCRYITEQLVQGEYERTHNPRPSRLAHDSSSRIPHKFSGRLSGRRPEPAPRAVVAPAAGGRPATAVEAQPPLHVCFGHPHPLFAPSLGEHHDVGHGSIVAAGSIR